jgi:X-X-X-Leu-X-X-Gly heptad repeat protein
MSTEETPTPPAEQPPIRKYSPQNARMITKLGQGAITIRNSMADTEAAPLLAEIKYDQDALQDLLDLHYAAVAAVTARQLADGAQDAATKAFKLADKAGRKAFTAPVRLRVPPSCVIPPHSPLWDCRAANRTSWPTCSLHRQTAVGRARPDLCSQTDGARRHPG